MSLFAALRTTARQAAPRVSRQYSAAAPSAENAFVAEREAIKHHAAKSGELWRKITYFVAVPCIIAGYLNAMNIENDHIAHAEHIKEENGGEAPERVVYPYFNKRDKDFPWGSYTLFYNPHANIPLPDDA